MHKSELKELVETHGNINNAFILLVYKMLKEKSSPEIVKGFEQLFDQRKEQLRRFGDGTMTLEESQKIYQEAIDKPAQM